MPAGLPYNPSPVTSQASRAPYLALTHRDYRRLIAAQLLSLTGSQMQVVAINWHVYLLTKSPLALGFVGLTRVVPIVAFSLWGGVVADRHDRRRIMLMTQAAMTVVALALWGVTATGTRDSVAALHPERPFRLGRRLRRALAAGPDPAPGAAAGSPGRALPGTVGLPGLADRRAGDRRHPHRAPSWLLADGGDLADLPSERNLVPGRHLCAGDDAHLRCGGARLPGERELGGPARGAEVRLQDSADGLDDGPRFPGDLLLGRDVPSPDLRRPGPARGPQGLRHSGRGAGGRRARRRPVPLGASLAPEPGTDLSLGGGGLRRVDDRLRLFPQLPPDAPGPGRNRPVRLDLDGDPPDAAPVHHARTGCAGA